MSQIRNQGTKSPFKRDEQSLNSSSLYLTDQFNQEEKKKQQQQAITISAMTQKLLIHSEKNGFDKYLKVNLVKLAEKLIQKKQLPKFIVENSIDMLKLLNKTASKFVEVKDYNQSMLILDLALRISTSVKNGIESDQQQFITLNNIAILCSKIGKVSLSKKYLKIVLKKIEKIYKENKTDTIEIVEAITLNNLCSFYVKEDKYEKVYKLSEMALILIENKLFKRIKEEGENTLKKDTQFVSDLHILLQGYIYRGWSQDEIKNHAYQDYILSNQQGEELFSDKQKIYNNGYRLSNIILGKQNMMTINFQQLLKQAKSEQQEILKSMEKQKDGDLLDEQSGHLGFYQNRIKKVAIIYEQQYIQLSMEDKLYILKQIFAKTENQNMSESNNNITIIDSQEDIEDSQEFQGLNFIKTEYIKPTQSTSLRTSPNSNKKFRTIKHYEKTLPGNKFIFRNQSPNFRVNQNYSKGKYPNNQQFYNTDFHYGMKERAQSYHSGVNQKYFLNQTSNNMIRGLNDNNYVGSDPHQLGLNQTNIGYLQSQQQNLNNLYPNEANLDLMPINNGLIDFQPQSLNRHQQLQQQLYMQSNQNGLLYQNKNRFNNPASYFQNPNLLNNTADYQNNNQILNQQNDYTINQMTNYNQQMPQFNQQSNLGASIQPNQYIPHNRINSAINGLPSQVATQQQYLPQIQTQGMTPTQVLQAQLTNLGNFKYPFQNGLGINSSNNSGSQPQQNQFTQKNIAQNNNQQAIQDENNKISQKQINFFNQNKDNTQSNQQVQQTNDDLSQNNNKQSNQNNMIKNKAVENGKNSPQNQNIDNFSLRKQQSNHGLKEKTSQQNSQKLNHLEVNEANQQKEYFILNKEYHVPESAAFPNQHGENKNLNESRDMNQQQTKIYQDQAGKVTGTFNSEQIKRINESQREVQLNINKNVQQEYGNTQQGQYNIPLHLIDNKNNSSQNGEVTKNNKSTQPSSQMTPQTNNQTNSKPLFEINKFEDNSQQKKVTNDQKRQKYQEQYHTKEIVSLKNIPNIGFSQLEMIEKPNRIGASNQNSAAINNQANNIQKEEEGQKDEVLQKQQIIHTVGNLKLSESTAYNPASPKNLLGLRENANQAQNSPQVNQNNAAQAAKQTAAGTSVQSPTNYINNVIMLQNQQFQSPQVNKLTSNLKKIKDEEMIASKMGSPQCQSPQSYNHVNKFQINTNQNAVQLMGNMGSGTLNSAGYNINSNGQQFVYPQNNQATNNKLPMTSCTNISQQVRVQSKQRIPSINAMIQNINNSQNTQMFASDISLTKNQKQSEFDVYIPIGSQKQNQWALFNDNEVDYLRHIKIDSLINANCSVTKILQFNSIQYQVEVSINKNTQEITFSGFEMHDKVQLITESLTLPVLKGILNMLDLNEGTPYNKPFKTIQGFKDLCQYLIFPFIRINPQERKIEMNYSNYSILQYQQWSIEFLKTTCLATFIHLNNNEFKFTLRQAGSQQSNIDKDFIRIDINFDEATIKSQFQKLEYTDEQGNEVVDNYERDDIKYIVDISDLIDEENNKKDSLLQEITNMMTNSKKHQKIQLTNYQIPNTIIFCQKLNDLINLVSSYLIKNHNITSYQQYVEDQSLKVLRIHINEDFKKGQIFFIKESNPQPKTVCVSIQNIHETHAPHGKMVQCVGKKEVLLEEFWKTFGVQYENLDKEERYYFLTLIGLKYNLYTHTKPLELDDYSRYQENPIIANTLSIGGFSRTLKGTSYKSPMTCQLIGIDDVPFGVKVVLHDLEQNSESGVFYIIDSVNWTKFKRQEDPNVKKKRTKKYKDEYDIIQNYELTSVLYSVGFKLLENSICIRKYQSSQIYIAGRNLYSGFISNVDRFENVVNLAEIASYMVQQQ
ncbi:hypothetical protein ABPG72_001013 [Tetrahymena utriculariae]